MTALPRSLQSLIADAQRSQLQRETTEAPEEEYDWINESIDEFFDGLCRGEYTEDLYWECVTDDCEEDGDWDGAKAACQKIIELEDDSIFVRCKAYSRLAGLHALLGEENFALENYHAATLESKNDDCDVFHRLCLYRESWQLIRMARFRAASVLAREGLSMREDDFADFIQAELLTALAMCYLAKGRINKIGRAHV